LKITYANIAGVANQKIFAAQSWIEIQCFSDILCAFPQFLFKISPKSQYFWIFSQMQPMDRYGLATPESGALIYRQV
jgi:hypothetical protein